MAAESVKVERFAQNNPSWGMAQLMKEHGTWCVRRAGMVGMCILLP
jgi:hypothetical protein